MIYSYLLLILWLWAVSQDGIFFCLFSFPKSVCFFCCFELLTIDYVKHFAAPTVQGQQSIQVNENNTHSSGTCKQHQCLDSAAPSLDNYQFYLQISAPKHST